MFVVADVEGSDACAGGWTRSAACMGGDCVEVQVQPNASVLVRDSKSPNTILSFTGAEWEAFTQGVRNGEFDIVR